jgi:cadmium resistance protein CadD (predicted permease)
VIPRAYLGLLGILPIVIGIRKLSDLRRDASAPENSSQGSVAGVTLVTIANGGDNIAIYIPAFAVHSGAENAVIAMVFVAMTALWCMLAHWMVNHRRFGAPLRRYGHIFAPMVLIGLGLVIIYKAGTMGWLLRHTSH